jgi:methyl-accepting chemotaxis protein
MRKIFQLKSIKTQITVPVIGIVAIVCIGLAICSYFVTAAGLKANLDDSLQAITAQAANMVNGRINKHFSQLNTLASLDMFKDIEGNKARILATLKQMAVEYGHINMAIVDAEGNDWNTDGGTANLADREYFQKVMQGQNAISDPMISKTMGKLIVVQAAPIKNKLKEVVGAVLLTRDGNGLSTIIKDITYGKSGKAFMINKQGTSIAHYDKQLVLAGDNIFENEKKDHGLKPLANIQRKMVQGESGVGKYRYQGVEKYLAYCPVPGVDWSLALAAPVKEAFASLDRMRNIIVVVSLIFLVLGGVISYMMAHRISVPLQEATSNLEEISLGDVERDVAISILKRCDEVGKLGTAAQKITDDLREKASAAERIAGGDLNVRLKMKSGKDVLTQNLNIMAENIHHVIEDINMLAAEAVKGNLDVRADAACHSGDYQKIVVGINNTLEAIIIPLNAGSKVIKEMTCNNFTVMMQADQYQGMLRQFAEGIDLLRTRLAALQNGFMQIAKGDISLLEEYRKIGRRSENDRMMPAVIEMMQTIQNLIDEVERLSEAAISGDLKIRGNAAQFEGGYQQIVNEFNQSLGAIIEPINETSEVLQEMATGNLNVQVSGNYNGDHALLAQAVNHTIDSFNEVLGEFSRASGQVASGAEQVSDSSQVLSQAASEQASTTEEITASITEIAAQTKQNAANANQANQLAIAAKEQATAGNEQMQKMLVSMAEINESSANISKIIKVIDEIAFQTNILALNAAVEAARAGQHGKGFAVVAEEVRNLAARSAKAAKETTALIEGSIQKVEGGTQIANETAASLNRIVDGVAKAADLVGDIAAASNEQASAIAQVNQGINQIAQVTQTNTATSEESAGTSEELASQAEALQEMVRRFKLKNNVGQLDTVAEKQLPAKLMEKTKPEKHKEDQRQITLNSNEFGKY